MFIHQFIFNNFICSTSQNCLNSLDSKYISAELELDIDTRSLSSQNLNSTIQNYSTTSSSNYISAELEFDIDTKSLSTQNLSSIGQNFSTSSKRRRNEVFLNIETHGNSEVKIFHSSAADTEYMEISIILSDFFQRNWNPVVQDTLLTRLYITITIFILN
ncbi:1880_t:CDS:2 [Rhizophagus irregularis]|nr:1880_t:CDS:2 [Rhizophagus irregularis]